MSELPKVTRAMMESELRRGGATRIEVDALGLVHAHFEDHSRGNDLDEILVAAGVAVLNFGHGREIVADVMAEVSYVAH